MRARTIELYLARQIFAAVGFVLLGFLALFAFFDLIHELGDLGRGNYQLRQLFIFVLLSLPAHAYELFPVVVLIGTLYVLAHLASNSEFTVMRGSGMSPLNAAGVLARTGVAFVVLTFAFGEWIAPGAEEAGPAVARPDAAAEDIEARLEALMKLDPGPDPGRVAMAREALANAAAIVRKEAVAVREGIAFNAAREALAQHMHGAASRSGPWVSKAIALKKALDGAYFNYKFALDGFAVQLDDVPDQDLAGQVRARIDATLEHARAALARSGRLG